MVQYDGLFLFPKLLFEFSEIERVAPQQSRELLNGLQENCQPRKIYFTRESIHLQFFLKNPSDSVQNSITTT